MRRALLSIALALGCGNTASAPATPGRPPRPPQPTADAAVAVAPDAPPGPLDGDLPRLAERGVALYAAIAAAFRVAGTDCVAATQKLGELRPQYAEVTAANAKVLRDGRAKELEAALAKHDDTLEAATKEIVGSQTMSKCSTDPAFEKAFDDLVGTPP